MKVYITKYALSKGIMEVEAGSLPSGGVEVSNANMHHYFYGNDWHMSKLQAIERACDMRNKKILSLQKQIHKLQNLNFE